MNNDSSYPSRRWSAIAESGKPTRFTRASLDSAMAGHRLRGNDRDTMETN